MTFVDSDKRLFPPPETEVFVLGPVHRGDAAGKHARWHPGEAALAS